jgi:hypothetical protein
MYDVYDIHAVTDCDIPVNGDTLETYLTSNLYTGLELFTLMKFHITVFWIMTPCSYVVGYQCFGGLCCLHEDGSTFKILTFSESSRIFHIHADLVFSAVVESQAPKF